MQSIMENHKLLFMTFLLLKPQFNTLKIFYSCSNRHLIHITSSLLSTFINTLIINQHINTFFVLWKPQRRKAPLLTCKGSHKYCKAMIFCHVQQNTAKGIALYSMVEQHFPARSSSTLQHCTNILKNSKWKALRLKSKNTKNYFCNLYFILHGELPSKSKIWYPWSCALNFEKEISLSS